MVIRPTKGGSLGVNTLGPSDTSAAPDGLKIRSVVPGSGAFDAGLRPGDIITHVDGQRMVDQDRLSGYVSGLAVGATVKVKFRRDGKYQTVPVKLKDASITSQPAAGSEAAAEPESEKQRGTLGVTLDNGAVILNVSPDSAAAKAGLQSGDAIVRIDDQPIKLRAEVGSDRVA